jgi:hypothetical protein
MALSDTACRNAHKSDKAKDGKAFKLFDEKGLFLLVKPTASGWGILSEIRQLRLFCWKYL